MLVDHSLVRRIDRGDGETRLQLLNTIREFALEQLDQSSESEPIHDAHAAFFLDYTEAASDVSQRGERARGLNLVEREVENLRTALTWLIARRDKSRALNLALALFNYWQIRASLDEARLWFDQCLALPGEIDLPLQMRVSRGLGWLSSLEGESDRAVTLGQEAFDAAEALGDAEGSVRALNALGAAAFYRDDLDSAKRYWLETKERAEKIGDTVMLAGATNNLGLVFALQGDPKRARDFQERSLALHRALGNDISAAGNLDNLAGLALHAGDHAAAISLIQQSMHILQQAHFTANIAEGLMTGAEIAAGVKDPVRAARLFAAGSAWYQQTGRAQPAILRRQLDDLRSKITNVLPAADFTAAWEAGSAMTLDQAIADLDELAPAPAEPEQPFGLTPRELEIIDLLVQGQSNQEIADALFISLRTAQTHVRNILAKLDLKSRTAVAGFALQHGIVRAPTE
jgi:non-specific serine/threonine protein kinase